MDITFLKKIWHFIWEEDSLLSWVVNVILAFILVKFVIYPGLGFLLATTHPLVAVVSNSMEHDGLGFDNWWSQKGNWYLEKGIDKNEFNGFAFNKGFDMGDIMVLRGSKPENINIGDVIVFWGRSSNPIIHRVVSVEYIDNYIFQTKGDRNSEVSSYLGEDKITKDMVIGRAVLRIPYLGWIKIWFTELLK